MSGCSEIAAPAARSRVLDRAELPVDTAELARFLIGKMLMRMLAEGVAGGRIVERLDGRLATPNYNCFWLYVK